MDLWVGLLIGVSGVTVAFLAYAVVRVGSRKPTPRDVPPRPARSPLDWRAGDPYRTKNIPHLWQNEEHWDE